MRVVLCEQPGRLAVVERPRPVAGAGEVLVRIRRCGRLRDRLPHLRREAPLPGISACHGARTCRARSRPRPRGAPSRPARTSTSCPTCRAGAVRPGRKGLTNACMTIRVLGVHCDGGDGGVPGRAGGQRRPGERCLRSTTPPWWEFLAIGAPRREAGRRSRAPTALLVVGSGPIGMSAIIFAKARGAHVTVMDTREERLAFAADRLAARCDADGRCRRGGQRRRGDGRRRVRCRHRRHRQCRGPCGAGFGFIGHGGRYVLVSVVRDDVSFSDPEFHKREATLFASPERPARRLRRGGPGRWGAGMVPTSALNHASGGACRGPQPVRGVDAPGDRRHQGAHRGLTAVTKHGGRRAGMSLPLAIDLRPGGRRRRRPAARGGRTGDERRPIGVATAAVEA